MRLDISSFLKWQPSSREQTLLKMVLGLGFAGALLMTYDYLKMSVADQTDANARLIKVQAEMAQLSNKDFAAFLAEQHRELVTLTMNDPTKPLSDLRMREELTELALRSGLTKVSVSENAPSLADTPTADAQIISALQLTLEAEFAWQGLVRLTGQLEEFYRGYLIDGIEVRNKGELRQMRITLRILHEPQERNQ